jgi:cytochrome P450
VTREAEVGRTADDVVERARVGGQDVVVVLGHERVRRVARDWTTYTSATPFRVPIPEESALRPVRQYPIETDPPAHTAYRQLIAHRFSRSAADAIRPTIVALVGRLLDRADGRQLQVVRHLALPVVTTSIAETMGLPRDVDRLQSWGLHVFRDPSTGERRRNDDLDDYLAARVDAALADPGDDLFGDLARARFDGRPLTRDELLGYGYLVLAGGRDTVIGAISGAIWHLAAHPDVRGRLAADPDLIPDAVEEYLRYLSPLASIGRTVTVDHELDGHRLAAGELVALGFDSANHDPAAFASPDEVRIDRRPNRHVAFGHGPHTCIGAPLARMEITVVIEAIASLARCDLVAPATWVPHPEGGASTSSWLPHDLTVRIGR